MNRQMWTGVGVGVAIAATIGAVAGYRISSGPEFAEVISSQRVTETQRVARQDCRDEQVTQQKPVKDEKRVAGAAIGAVIGGVLGNQVGDGSGQTLATVAGAAAGGYAGSKVQKRMQTGNLETVTEQRCKTVYDTREKPMGFDVSYRLNGQTRTVRTSRELAVGTRLPVIDGQAVLPGEPAG